MRVVVDGHELPPIDAIESLSIHNLGDPETDTGSSDLFITLRPESRIKQGQSVFVSYDMDMAMAFAPGLQDLSGNFVHNFTQVLDNFSDVFNDQEAPTLFAPPELNPDGQTFTLTFNEPLDTQTINTQDIAHSFRVFVDGNDFADNFDAGPRPLFDDNATTLSPDGTALTLKLDGRSIESSQQILIAYDPTIAGAPLYDTANNNLEAFIFSVMNSSALDFTPPQITGEPSVEPSGQSINIAFSEMVDVDDELAARSAFKVSVDGTALSNDEFSVNANGGASLQINLNDRVYNDQIVTVAYDPSVLFNTAGELTDNNGNFVVSFNQLVNTSAIRNLLQIFNLLSSHRPTHQPMVNSFL